MIDEVLCALFLTLMFITFISPVFITVTYLKRKMSGDNDDECYPAICYMSDKLMVDLSDKLMVDLSDKLMVDLSDSPPYNIDVVNYTKTMNKNLIFDGLQVRECPSNKCKLGYWGTVLKFHSYRVTYKKLFGVLNETAEYIGKASCGLLLSALFICLAPILPFVFGLFDYRNAVRDTRRFHIEREDEK